jgi:hypothetical protein
MRGTGAAVSSTEVTTGLSLTSELFLIAIDPATGRLVKRRRRRFRKALAGSYGASGPGAASRARRSALGELRAAGLLERSLLPGQHPFIPGSGASAPFARLRRCIVYEGLRSPRDVELFVLLVWSGVLARRLSRSERTRAQRRLRALFAPPPSQDSSFAPIPPIAAALGSVAFREEMDHAWEMVNDLLSGDPITFDGGGSGSGGGGEVGGVGGGESGGGDGGGGGGGGGGD